MSWQTSETTYGMLEELEWPDLWDDYERAARSFVEAHEGPMKKYGISEADGIGCLMQQLRILDTSGECLARLRRTQDQLRRAESKLKSKLELLPNEWRSEKTFHRILCVLNLEECCIYSDMAKAFRKMYVDNRSLEDLIALAKTRLGLSLAIEAVVKVGTIEARAALVEISHDVKAKGDHKKSQLINDAAVAISVNLHDRHVIPVLVNRLVAAYGKPVEEREVEPIAIIESLLSVIEHARGELQPALLQQLSGLGGEESEEVEGQPKPKSRLGIQQAIIAHDLRPVRDVAKQELRRRAIAS
jgi:hypothetical protein